MPITHATLSGRFMANIDDKKYAWGRLFVLVTILAVADAILASSFGLIFYKAFKGFFIHPTENGFYCNDESIRKPWKPNTVSPLVLIATIMGTSPFFIAFCETVLFRKAIGKNLLPKWVKSCALEYVKFIIGFTLCISAMEIFKSFFGRLRPNFIDVCKPNWSLIDCATDPTAYIRDAHCTGKPHDIKNARSSFPSGHAAAAGFFACYFALYLQRMAKAIYLKWFDYAAIGQEALIVVWTIFVLMTRITDFRHHYNDIIFGTALGFIFSYAANAVLNRKDVHQERDILKVVKFE